MATDPSWILTLKIGNFLGDLDLKMGKSFDDFDPKPGNFCSGFATFWYKNYHGWKREFGELWSF